MKRMIPVEQAVGMVLPHDMTRIVRGEFKGRAFKKGHVVRDEDVAPLLSMGKEHICVLDLGPGLVHEDEAAKRIARAAAGEGILLSEPCEGRINMAAAVPGLLTIDVDRLTALNSIEDVVLATVHTNQFVPAGRAVAGTRIVPLAAPEETVAAAEKACAGDVGLIRVAPLKKARVGMVTTGSEVYHGRIEDQFGPVLRKKFKALGCEVFEQILVSDDVEMTVAAINKLVAKGADMIVCTGGMSVDPDDQTPASIRAAGAKVTAYGSPTFPGAMFMLAHIGEVPVLGLPGCVMYYRASIFDLVVPRILAGQKLGREDITAMAHGGFCNSCDVCRYPVCPFGKGS